MQRSQFLIIDDDPEVHELITEQIFTDGSFSFLRAMDGVEGLQIAQSQKPDLILLDLVLPNLSGLDLLVALKQDGYDRPIIVATKRGAEQKAIEAFRLGASDFITKPLRPPELVAAVERSLKDVKLRRERDQLVQHVQASNQALEARVKELTLITEIAHALSANQNIESLFERILSHILDLTQADHATVILRDNNTGKLRLYAGRNLTLVMQDKLGEEIRDEVADIVMTSQAPLVAEGDGLARFNLPRDIRAVIYVPLMVRGAPIGVLTVGNHKKRTGFTQSQAQLMNTIADYVALGVTNARLLSTLDLRARNTESAMQATEAERQALLAALRREVGQPLVQVEREIGSIADEVIIEALKGRLQNLQKQTQSVLRSLHHLSNADAKPKQPPQGVYRIKPQG